MDLADCFSPGIPLVEVGWEGGIGAETTAKHLGNPRWKAVRQLLLALADSFSPGKGLDFHQVKSWLPARTWLTFTWWKSVSQLWGFQAPSDLTFTWWKSGGRELEPGESWVVRLSPW